MAKAKKHLHEKRRITFQELGAVLGTRALLAGGHIKHASTSIPVPGAHVFNMHEACLSRDCGTVACIGGTMGLLMGLPTDWRNVDARNPTSVKHYVGNGFMHGAHSPALKTLFFPPSNIDWDLITNKIAVKAIDNWLATGRPSWQKLVKAY